jgi:hypothetical protein
MEYIKKKYYIILKMYYYLCARCSHITNQKIEMKRHLEKKKKCCINNQNNILNDEELYNISLEKHYKLNNKINEKKNEKNEHICDKCHKKFSNKGNLNKHLKLVCYNKIKNTTNNIQNIGIQNIHNNFINISLTNPIKGFDQEWNTGNIDHQKKGEILLSNSKFTKTLENILNDKINLNVIMDQDDKTCIVYNNKKKKYEPMTKKDIIEKSMKKVYNHLKQFYDEINKNNINDLSIKSLENELNILETKYANFFKFDDAKKIVNNSFSKLYIDKKEEAENIYYDFIKDNNLIEEY